MDNYGAAARYGCNGRLVDTPAVTNPEPYTGALATVRAAKAGAVKLDKSAFNLLVPITVVIGLGSSRDTLL